MMSTKWGIGKLTALAMVGMAAMTAQAATNAQIDTSIDEGLAYLASQAGLGGGGSWAYGGYNQAATGAAVYAMVTQQNQWGANAAAYQTDVNNGIAYLLSTATLVPNVGLRSDGVNICPGGGTCSGVYWYGAGETTYTTGLVATAIGVYAAANPSAVATTAGPLAGMTWTQIAQGITNTFAQGQTTANNAVYAGAVGGWRYFPGTGDSDMSTTQWAALAMIYDQTLGAITPASTKTLLANNWLPFAQASNGSACYQGPSSFCEAADTGGLLISLNFVGKTASDPAVVAAMNYLNANWTQFANSTWYGNFDQPYAMWAEYKGLETMIGTTDNTVITNLLDAACDGGVAANAPTSGVCNWWQDYNQWLVANQIGDGSWSGSGYWTGVLATAFDLPILGGTEIPTPPPTNVPEPATLALVGLGIAAMATGRRRKSA